MLIASAAFSLGAATLYLHGVPLHDQWPRLTFLWLATFGFYGLHDLVTKRSLPAAMAARIIRVDFWQRYGDTMLRPLGMAALAMGWIALRHFNRHDLWQALVLVVLSLLYTLPLLPIPGLRRFKDHPLLKILVLSGVWTLATTTFLIPPFSEGPGWAFIGARWLFVLLLCIPFDVRDAAADRANMRRTLPDLLGHSRLTWWLAGIATIGLVLQYMALSALQQPVATQALLAGHLVLTSWLARHAVTHHMRQDLFLLLDLQMVVQATIVGLCGWLA